MNKVTTITCVFCKGIGENPHFTGTCPVCKGKGENQIRGKFMTCGDCRGLGQKRGTTLTCFTCGGLGIVPDTREIVAKAREEIRRAREEMEKERGEFQEKPKARGDDVAMEEVKKLKAENERLQKRLSKADRGRKKDGVGSAIGSYCEDCVLGENKECWDIECALAPFSPVAKTIVD